MLYTYTHKYTTKFSLAISLQLKSTARALAVIMINLLKIEKEFERNSTESIASELHFPFVTPAC